MHVSLRAVINIGSPHAILRRFAEQHVLDRDPSICGLVAVAPAVENTVLRNTLFVIYVVPWGLLWTE